MLIEEITQEDNFAEGVNDPAIFKAIFLSGGPGSGKSFVAKKLLTGLGMKTINSDDIYEYLAKKQDLDLRNPDAIASPQGQEIRNRAKQITKNKETSHLDGRLGIIIDGTGKDVEKVAKHSAALKSLGYEPMMLFVNTSEEVSQQRNQDRPRVLKRDVVSSMWKQVQSNIMKFQQIFGSKDFHVVDNSGGLEDPTRAENFKQVEKSIRAFVTAPVRNRVARKWIQDNS